MAGQTKRHHVVSWGYQRNFAVGERPLLIDKATKAAKLVGTGDAFLVDRFNSYLGPDGWDDTPEREWARVENMPDDETLDAYWRRRRARDTS